MGNSPTNETATGKSKTRIVGHAALSSEEKLVLTWTPDERLAEFQKANPNVDTRELETKLLYIDNMSVDNGEIQDVLRVNPKVTWQIVRDMFTSGEVDGYTSTFHGLDDIKYPPHFWKAIIENEREKLIRSG